jgi:Lon protease-like protein
VLFPALPLPLHIFEPRYRVMIRRCLEERIEFGVVLARAEGIAPVGCTAEVLEVTKRYPDGRMDILTAGRRLIRIVEVYEDQPYYEAQVEYLASDPRPLDRPKRDRLLTLFKQCHNLLFGRPPQRTEPDSEVPLSYQIASALPLDIEYKQELLENLAEADREAQLLEHMQNWLPQLVRMNHVRKKAGGNGHGLGSSA